MSFEVDAERVQSAATATAGTSRNLVSEAQTMLRNLLALQECWRGSAAQNFQAVINQWEGAQKQLFESLDSIHAALNTATQYYSEVEALNSRLFATESPEIGPTSLVVLVVGVWQTNSLS